MDRHYRWTKRVPWKGAIRFVVGEGRWESRKRAAWKAYGNHHKGIRCPLSALSSLRSIPAAFPRVFAHLPVAHRFLLHSPTSRELGGAKVGLMAPQGTRQLAEKTIPVAKSVRSRRVGQRFFFNLLFRLMFSPLFLCFLRPASFSGTLKRSIHIS